MGELAFLQDLLIISAVALVVVALLQRVGVPTIAGFILAGVLVGPKGFAIIQDRHEVEVLAEIGVALLLFGIGLELQLSRLNRLWKPIALAGALQLGVTILATALIGLRFGLTVNGAVFLGFLVALSSTAIVLRGLEARGEIDAPHGRLTLGVLIIQDLGVVPMMFAIPLLAGEAASALDLAWTLGKAAAVLAGVLLAARVIVPRTLHAIARTRQRDLFVLTVFLVSVGTAWVTSHAGVSLALGAFLAGLVVAGSEYRHQALAELIPLRDILTSIFFISIGMLLNPAIVARNPGPVLGLLAAILTGKFLIVLAATALMRLPIRVSVLTAAALAQVGEFSFVLYHAGADTNLLAPGLRDHLLAAAILSMLVTPLALAAGPRLAAGADRIRPLTRLLEVRTADDALQRSRHWEDHVIIAGFGITGEELARSLNDCGVRYVIVDLNPENVRRATRQGEPAFFGDVTSTTVLEDLGVDRAREIVLVLNDPRAAERSVRALRRIAPRVRITVRARYAADVDPLLAAGATEVVPAEIEAAIEVVSRVLMHCAVDPSSIHTQLEGIRSRHRDARQTASANG